MAANLALLQQAGQANFLNIGSAHLAQSSPAPPFQPEPTTFGFSFSALGASLAEVASSSADAGTPWRRLTPNRRHLHPPPRRRLRRTTVYLTGFLVRSWRLTPSCRVHPSSPTNHSSRWCWTAARPTTTSTLPLHPVCEHTCATSNNFGSLTRSSPPARTFCKA